MMRLRDRFDPEKRKPSTRNQRIGFATFWLLVLALAYFIPVGPDFNTESHLFPAFSIVDHHTLNIDAYHVRLGDESYWHGHYYTDKAPGLSFLAIAPYVALRHLLPNSKAEAYMAFPHMYYAIRRNTVYIRYAITYLLVMLPAAIFAILLWLFLTRISGEQGWSLFLSIVYALGTTAYVYSTWYFSHQICAILLFCAFLLIFTKIRGSGGFVWPDTEGRKQEVSGGVKGWPPLGAATTGHHASENRSMLFHAAAAGALAGYAVISEYPTIVIAGLLGIYLVAVAPRRALAALAYVVGMVPAALLNLWYNFSAFGKPFATGYAYVHSVQYQSTVHVGKLGLASPASYGVQAPSLNSIWEITFGTYRGIFLLSPVLLLFFVSLRFMWKRLDLRKEFFLCLAVVLVYFLIDASRGADQNGWSGGASAGSRHLVPMLPFMIVPMATALRSRSFRTALVILGASSMVVMLSVAGVEHTFDITDHNPLLHEVIPHLLKTDLTPNWGSILGLKGYWSVLPLPVVALPLIGRIIWLLRKKPETERPKAPALIPVEAV